MSSFGRDVLGKGVVVCKDTPNFIGNRFFSVAGSYAMEYALEKGYTVNEIDTITGPTVGRPKTATYRLMDLVGIDVMAHVNGGLYGAIPEDDYREILQGGHIMPLIEKLVENKWLGNKSGQGFYKKVMVNGNREFWTLNPATMEYEASDKARFDSIGAVRKIEDLGERLRQLLTYDDRAATYIRDTLYFNLEYAAYVAPKIAYKLSDVDKAVKWGFSHEAGPFEIWDMLGVAETAVKMEASGYKVAGWVKEMLAAGHNSFYENGSVYDFTGKQMQPRDIDKNIVVVENLHGAGKEVARNDSASLLDMGDGVMLFEFHAKMNAIDDMIIGMGHEGLKRLDTDFDAMVIGNDGDNFCVGANLFAVGVAAGSERWDDLNQMIHGLQ
ncbi:MAG: hypothetical protein KC421_24920, partial [Anaerolineales bacterium]|nr:hypothetical protein [Anaerolineales bacterium]